MGPVRKRATYQDVLDAPEHLVAELINGVLETSPRPATKHTNSASLLGAELTVPFARGRGGPGGWVILDEPELHLSGDVLVPDLAGWRRERLAPDQLEQAYFAVVPDWVCEVLSPSTFRLDRLRKMPIYAKSGVGFIWLLDPDAKSIEVYKLADGKWLQLAIHEGDGSARIEPFDAIELSLQSLWTL